MPVAYSYIRFSSEKQRLGDSVRRQVELAERYAARHGLTLDHSSYRDLAISAYKGRNAIEGQLGTFLRGVERGVIPSDATLLIEDFDRLSRDEIDNALVLFLRIVQSGITLVTLKDEQVYTRERIRKDQASLIVSIMYMGRAHDESQMKSRRIKGVWDEKRASGKPMTAVAPSWLQLSPDRSSWKVLPDKAATVKRIFKLALAGNGAPNLGWHTMRQPVFRGLGAGSGVRVPPHSRRVPPEEGTSGCSRRNDATIRIGQQANEGEGFSASAPRPTWQR